VHEGRDKLIVFLAQTNSLLKPAGGSRDASPSERDHVWMGAVKKDVLLLSYIISIAQVTSRGGVESSGHSFNL